MSIFMISESNNSISQDRFHEMYFHSFLYVGTKMSILYTDRLNWAINETLACLSSLRWGDKHDIRKYRI